MKTSYFAEIEQEGDIWSVVFPDFDGCVTVGDSFKEAVDAAQEALQGHIECMLEDDEALPEMSMPNPTSANAKLVLVTVYPQAGMVRKNITIDASLWERIGRVNSNRSGFLAEAAREKLKAVGN